MDKRDIDRKHQMKEEAIYEEYETDYFMKCAYLDMSLDEAMDEGSLDGISQAINYSETTKGLSSIFHDDLNIQKLYVASFINSLVKTAIQKGLESGTGAVIKREFFVKISQSIKTEQLAVYSRSAAEKIFTSLKSQEKKMYSRTVRLSMEYISSNRFRKILPKDIAEEIKVNRSYLSALFTKETGMTITDYIQNVKINAAYRYLDSHLYKPSEISDLLHFSSYSYFCKIFKKQTGLSPREYQNRQITY